MAAKQGGDLIFSAEQEPDCMDWIGSCAGAAWGIWTVQVNTMPRAYVINNKSTFTPGDLLSGPADFVATPTEKITYHINPKAVWSDGQPITSHDFKYTWQQITTGKDIYSTSGYDQIGSVDDTDPHTAVVTMKTPFADWQSLFSENYGVFPSHLLEGKDRDAMMKDGYTFSGGPWMLDHWTKGTEIKLVPNPMFWGKKPNVASMTFKFLTDTAAEQAAFKSGQVEAVYPQAQPGGEALKQVPGVDFSAISGLDYEALWFETAKAPVDSKAVRQALAYATDRDAIVSQLFSAIQPDIKPIQSMYTPAFGKIYSTPYSKYKVDLAMVTQLMTGDGWAKGADGIWAKGGQRAALELKTTTGNKRRELTAQILQSEWKAAGFDLKITLEKAGVLFGKDLPAGNFQVSLFAQTPGDTDPSECSVWCSKNIPSAANGNNGTNWYRINDPALDKAYLDADSNLDPAARIQDAIDGQKVLSEDVPALPLDPFPDIIAINGDKVGTDQGKFEHNFVDGPYVYANHFFVK
ncbi:MAG: ABC transporter family substrate-binding protein [Acidimicrobiales bacterium]